MTSQPHHSAPSEDAPSDKQSSPELSPGRRRLLKALVGTGSAVAASTMLPERWFPPLVEMSVLPAHAQTSPVPTPTETPTETPVPADTATPTPTPTETLTPTPTETPTETPTPTPTPVVYTFLTCVTQSQSPFCTDEIAVIDPTITYADISPAQAGIQLLREVVLNRAGHPLDGQVVFSDSGPTNASGRYTAPDFTLFDLT